MVASRCDCSLVRLAGAVRLVIGMVGKHGPLSSPLCVCTVLFRPLATIVRRTGSSCNQGGRSLGRRWIVDRFSGTGLRGLFLGAALERSKKLLTGGGCRIFVCCHEIARGLLVQLDRVFDRDGGTRRTILQRGTHVDRKSDVSGKSVSVRVDPRGRRIIKKKK